MIKDILHCTALITYIYVTYLYKDVTETEDLIYSWWSLSTIIMFCILLTTIEINVKNIKTGKSKTFRMFNVCD